jgi:hypothetical protein
LGRPAGSDDGVALGWVDGLRRVGKSATCSSAPLEGEEEEEKEEEEEEEVVIYK